MSRKVAYNLVFFKLLVFPFGAILVCASAYAQSLDSNHRPGIIQTQGPAKSKELPLGLDSLSTPTEYRKELLEKINENSVNWPTDALDYIRSENDLGLFLRTLVTAGYLSDLEVRALDRPGLLMTPEESKELRDILGNLDVQIDSYLSTHPSDARFDLAYKSTESFVDFLGGVSGNFGPKGIIAQYALKGVNWGVKNGLKSLIGGSQADMGISPALLSDKAILETLIRVQMYLIKDPLAAHTFTTYNDSVAKNKGLTPPPNVFGTGGGVSNPKSSLRKQITQFNLDVKETMERVKGEIKEHTESKSQEELHQITKLFEVIDQRERAREKAIQEAQFQKDIADAAEKGRYQMISDFGALVGMGAHVWGSSKTAQAFDTGGQILDSALSNFSRLQKSFETLDQANKALQTAQASFEALKKAEESTEKLLKAQASFEALKKAEESTEKLLKAQEGVMKAQKAAEGASSIVSANSVHAAVAVAQAALVIYQLSRNQPSAQEIMFSILKQMSEQMQANHQQVMDALAHIDGRIVDMWNDLRATLAMSVELNSLNDKRLQSKLDSQFAAVKMKLDTIYSDQLRNSRGSIAQYAAQLEVSRKFSLENPEHQKENEASQRLQAGNQDAPVRRRDILDLRKALKGDIDTVPEKTVAELKHVDWLSAMNELKAASLERSKEHSSEENLAIVPTRIDPKVYLNIQQKDITGESLSATNPNIEDLLRAHMLAMMEAGFHKETSEKRTAAVEGLSKTQKSLSQNEEGKKRLDNAEREIAENPSPENKSTEPVDLEALQSQRVQFEKDLIHANNRTFPLLTRRAHANLWQWHSGADAIASELESLYGLKDSDRHRLSSNLDDSFLPDLLKPATLEEERRKEMYPNPQENFQWAVKAYDKSLEDFVQSVSEFRMELLKTCFGNHVGKLVSKNNWAPYEFVEKARKFSRTDGGSRQPIPRGGGWNEDERGRYRVNANNYSSKFKTDESSSKYGRLEILADMSPLDYFDESTTRFPPHDGYPAPGVEVTYKVYVQYNEDRNAQRPGNSPGQLDCWNQLKMLEGRLKGQSLSKALKTLSSVQDGQIYEGVYNNLFVPVDRDSRERAFNEASRELHGNQVANHWVGQNSKYFKNTYEEMIDIVGASAISGVERMGFEMIGSVLNNLDTPADRLLLSSPVMTKTLKDLANKVQQSALELSDDAEALRFSIETDFSHKLKDQTILAEVISPTSPLALPGLRNTKSSDPLKTKFAILERNLFGYATALDLKDQVALNASSVNDAAAYSFRFGEDDVTRSSKTRALTSMLSYPHELRFHRSGLDRNVQSEAAETNEAKEYMLNHLKEADLREADNSGESVKALTIVHPELLSFGIDDFIKIIQEQGAFAGDSIRNAFSPDDEASLPTELRIVKKRLGFLRQIGAVEDKK